ncbi:MAG: bifunctional diaminohydroxyphosphoribosylaminopyrimidine deaminase/5-amino-6-(5-phosphoribosylamino)uracil reductase, partial [Leptospiraceae bacterium]|nr:bifunctional diaminohydroxyphosphoribosylaminopyrimidine deaminase/5-amino-6-(5-phosphoribosylamino)uracil reductase [Leptospiraceae bacterium]
MKNIYNITHEIEEELVKQSFLAMGYSSPNPPVGCVLSDLEGNILSKGHTQKTGFDHAEISAYNNFTKTGVSHNVFVTLEPCTHTGKTPPCADTILKKRPESVFYGLKDPNPLVVDSSFEKKYSDEKIDISKSDEIQKIAKAYLNGFLSRIHFGRPAVLVKIVETKEGFFGSQDESVRISSPESDNMSQLLRAKFDGIIVGPKTISMDGIYIYV